MLLENWKKFLINRAFLENESQMSFLDNITDYFTFVNAINLSETNFLLNLTKNVLTDEYLFFPNSLKNLGDNINFLNFYYIESDNFFLIQLMSKSSL